MLAGLMVTVAYMVINSTIWRRMWQLEPNAGLWWGIQPVSAGVFGVAAGFAVMGVLGWILRPDPRP